MLKISSLTPRSRWAWLACVLACSSSCADDTGTFTNYHPAVKLLVFSDPHYFDPSLGTTGSAFDAYLANDRKLIAESDAIMRAMVAQVDAENPQVVLVSGDLTKDGEQLSHHSMAALLAQMKTGGRKVFVVPGNHDIQNDGASSYAGDTATPVPAISATDFADIYKDFGFGDAIARDANSLSYVVELVPGLWLLALDSCIYGDVRGPMQSSGRFVDGTQAWIQGQLDEAKKRGVRVMAMMHHGLVEHFAMQAAIFPEFVIGDRDAVAGLLSNGGVGLILTGHFHANDITRGTPSASTKSIYDVETGSAVTYPCPYRVIDVSNDTLAITTQHITSIDYDLGGQPDFQTYAHNSLRLGLETLITKLIEAPPYSVSPTDASDLAPYLGDGLVAHYAGDEVMPADAAAKAQELMSSTDFVMSLSGTMLKSIYTDLPPPDNAVTLDLATR
jgi:3',5'-cyclic AMP phosphodiesterase CpdA